MSGACPETHNRYYGRLVDEGNTTTGRGSLNRNGRINEFRSNHSWNINERIKTSRILMDRFASPKNPRYNSIQYNTVRCNLIKLKIVQCSAIQYDKIWCTTIHFNTIQYNAVQFNTVWYSSIQFKIIQYNSIQYNTIQCNTNYTIQYNSI